jgi:hypothetical protein
MIGFVIGTANIVLRATLVTAVWSCFLGGAAVAAEYDVGFAGVVDYVNAEGPMVLQRTLLCVVDADTACAELSVPSE